MPTLGEMLNMHVEDRKLIHVPEGFELQKKWDDRLSPNGIITLSVFHMKRNGELGHQAFSNSCLYWNEVVNEIRRCVNSTRPIKFHMRLSFKMYNKQIDEEMFHGTVTQEVLDELIEISEKDLKEE
jgi:hypothetical protein